MSEQSWAGSMLPVTSLMMVTIGEGTDADALIVIGPFEKQKK